MKEKRRDKLQSRPLLRTKSCCAGSMKNSSATIDIGKWLSIRK
jgi:hypothetical protein